MSYYSDTDPPTEASHRVKRNSKATRTHTAKAPEVETSGTQAQARARAQSSSRTRTKASEKKPRGAGYISADDTDDDWGYGPRKPPRPRGISDRRNSYLDSTVHSRGPPDRDSGYYGSTSASAYPWASSDYAFHGAYPGYAGPGQLVPTPYTGAIVPQVAPYQSTSGPLAPYGAGPRALAPGVYYDGAVTLRKTKLPGADERSSAQGTPSLNDVDVVWNVSSTKDVTLHLELDVEDDIDTNLREFIRFTRRGDYKRAEQYYQDNLASHSEQPEVVLEYIRMLEEKGSYKTIRDLGIDEAVLAHVCRSRTAPKRSQAVQLLLLLHRARSLSEPDVELSYNALMNAREFVERFEEETEEPQTLTPDMIQLLLLYVDLALSLRLESHFVVDLSPVEAILSLSLPQTYADLLADGRCWEIRDVTITSIKLFGLGATFSEIFPANSIAEALSRFVVSWKTMEGDELSDLALLDILNSIGWHLDGSEIWGVTPDPTVENGRQAASDLARILAASLKDNTPQLMKSRSYLEWLLLEEIKQREKGRDPALKSLNVKAFRSFPGKVLSYVDAFVYVPAGSENPGWPVSLSSASGDQEAALQLLSIARKTAHELGNYNLEAECLHELACQSTKPDKYLTELERFQISVKGNQLSLLKTRLMRFLTIAGSDEESRRLLKSQLLELDPGLLGVWSNFFHPMWEWAYRRVLYALMCSLGEADTEQAIAVDYQAQNMLHLLPGWARNNAAPVQHAHFVPMSGERYHSGMRDIRRRSSPPPPPPPARHRNRSDVVISTPRERQRFEEERGGRESKELSVKAPAGSAKIPTILETEEGYERQKSATYPPPSETKPSQSRERLRPEPDREVLEMKRQLEEYRQKQNELIRKRVEEEKVKEIERRVREEMHRMYEEKRRQDEEIRIEQVKARELAEREIKERVLREEEESCRRKRDEEELRARIETEIMREIALKEREKEKAKALEAKIKAEAFAKFELERKAKKEAAAAKRKAKKEQEAKEAQMYLEAEANAREKIAAELKAGVPRRRLRAILLGVSDSEGSDFERRLITEGAHSDSDSSVGTRRREARRHRRRSRRCSSSCSSCSEGGRRGVESTRRVIVEHYRRSPGGTMRRVDADSLDGDPENEIAVIEERRPEENEEQPQPQTESGQQQEFGESGETTSLAEPERAPDSVQEELPEETAPVVNETEEKTEEHENGNGRTSTMPEGGQDSSDDLLIPEGAADDAVVDNENDMDIYD